MLGPFTRCRYCRTRASMSTTMTTHVRGDHYGPIEWAQQFSSHYTWVKWFPNTYHKLLCPPIVPLLSLPLFYVHVCWCMIQSLLACAKDIAVTGPMGFFKVSCFFIAFFVELMFFLLLCYEADGWTCDLYEMWFSVVMDICSRPITELFVKEVWLYRKKFNQVCRIMILQPQVINLCSFYKIIQRLMDNTQAANI